MSSCVSWNLLKAGCLIPATRIDLETPLFMTTHSWFIGCLIACVVNEVDVTRKDYSLTLEGCSYLQLSRVAEWKCCTLGMPYVPPTC